MKFASHHDNSFIARARIHELKSSKLVTFNFTAFGHLIAMFMVFYNARTCTNNRPQSKRHPTVHESFQISYEGTRKQHKNGANLAINWSCFFCPVILNSLDKTR